MDRNAEDDDEKQSPHQWNDIDEGFCKSQVFLLTENLETKISNLF